MKIEYRVKENKVVAVRVGDTWVPVKNVPYEDRGKIKRNLEEQKELFGVFPLMGQEEKSDIERLADGMTDREKRLVQLLGKQEVPKVEIDKELKTKKRQIAGVLGNLTRKARDRNILKGSESAVPHREGNGSLLYYLHPKLHDLVDGNFC